MVVEFKQYEQFCKLLCYKCFWSIDFHSLHVILSIFFFFNSYPDCSSQVEPETLAVIKWMKNYNFILSANLHGGAVVANYPFDKSRDPRIRGRTTYSATPDDKIFRQVCSWLKVTSRCSIPVCRICVSI